MVLGRDFLVEICKAVVAAGATGNIDTVGWAVDEFGQPLRICDNVENSNRQSRHCVH